MTLFSPTPRQFAGALALAALLVVPTSLFAAAPANDVCTGAVVIPAGGPFPYAAATVDTTGTTNDTGDPDFACNAKYPSTTPGALSHSVWYSFTPSASDNYQIDTLGTQPSSAYDTILALFTGSCGSLVPVPGACNDDASGSLQSAVQVHLNAGTTYYILVSGLGSRDFASPNLIPSPGGSLKLNVSRVAVSYPYSYIIPSVAHSQGLALWVSDLNVTNVGGADGAFTIQFLDHATFGTDPAPAHAASAAYTIHAGGSVLFNDVLTAIGIAPSTNPYGALKIASTVRLLTGARTYTNAVAGPGTFGQYALGVDLAGGEIVANGESGRLIGVRENASTRTNFVVFNASNIACYGQFELRDANGNLLGAQQTRIVPPGTMVQKNGIRDFFATSDDVTNASIKVTDMSAGCQLGAIAYVIDGNTAPGSNDPFADPLQK